MEEFEKNIYNIYLGVARSIKNQPWKLRQNFKGFEEKEEYIYIVKLASFFKKHAHINIKSFFEAPFFVYNETYFDLSFFCAYKAIKTYTIYNDTFLIENPGCTIGLQKIKESIIFIVNYCKDNNINASNYISHTERESAYNVFLSHLKNRKISIYILFAFPQFELLVSNLHPDTKTAFYPLLNRLTFVRTKLYTIQSAKKNINIFKKYLETH